MENAIIICTSNYLFEDDKRSKLGTPIYSRFDEIIRFSEVCVEDIKRIIQLEYEKQFKQLDVNAQASVNAKMSLRES